MKKTISKNRQLQVKAVKIHINFVAGIGLFSSWCSKIHINLLHMLCRWTSVPHPSDSIRNKIHINFCYGIEQNFSGIICDFKFRKLAWEAEAFLTAKRSDLRHFFVDPNNYHRSNKINALNPSYVPNTSVF
jgi:hypothetical protein